MPGVYHGLYPDPYRFNGSADACADAALSFIRDQLFTHLVSPDEIAAIVVEPIQGEGGYIVPPRAFLQGLREMATSTASCSWSMKCSRAWAAPGRCSRPSTST